MLAVNNQQCLGMSLSSAQLGIWFAQKLDPTNPIYLQQVSNALYEIKSNLGFYPRRQDDLVFFERADLYATAKDQIALRYNYNTFRSPGSATSNPIATSGRQAYSDDSAQDHDAQLPNARVVVGRP